MKTIAFDCDGTLLDYNNTPRLEIIAMLRAFRNAGYQIIVWSGGGVNYARNVVDRLGLRDDVDMVSDKRPGTVDVAVDDQIVNLGQVNIQVDPAWAR